MESITTLVTRRIIFVLLLAIFAMFSAALRADIVVKNVRVMAPIPGQSVVAGYMDIENRGEKRETLVAFRSDAFGRIEIHQSIETDGMMRMEPVSVLSIEPGEIVVLEPGGLHMMLMMPSDSIGQMESVDLEIVGENSTARVSAKLVSYLE